MATNTKEEQKAALDEAIHEMTMEMLNGTATVEEVAEFEKKVIILRRTHNG